MSADLCGAVAAHGRWRTVNWGADGRPTRQVATIQFTREGWRKRGLPSRVLAVRSRERDSGKSIYLWEKLDCTVQVFLTNDLYSDEDDVAHRYEKRAGMEPLIAEFKTIWGIGRVSSASFDANHATLLLKLLAHNLLRRYINRHLPHLQSGRAPWIRRAVILVPGRLARSGGGHTIYMAPRPVLEDMRI